MEHEAVVFGLDLFLYQPWSPGSVFKQPQSFTAECIDRGCATANSSAVAKSHAQQISLCCQGTQPSPHVGYRCWRVEEAADLLRCQVVIPIYRLKDAGFCCAGCLRRGHDDPLSLATRFVREVGSFGTTTG